MNVKRKMLYCLTLLIVLAGFVLLIFGYVFLGKGWLLNDYRLNHSFIIKGIWLIVSGGLVMLFGFLFNMKVLELQVYE